MSPGIAEQALVGHVFAPATAEGLATLTELWAAASTAWSLTRAVAGGATRPPTAVPPGDGVLCIAGSADRPGLHQMMLQRVGERLCLRGVFSPPDGAWRTLCDRWDQVVASRAAGAATATVLTGIVAGRWGWRAAGGAVGTTAPPAEGGWLAADSAQGLRVFAPATPRTAEEQLLVVVAPRRRAAALDAWTWSDGTATLPPLGRYLMHGAALRHLRAALADQERPLTDLADRVDGDLAELRTLVTDGAARSAPAARRLLVRTELDQTDLAVLRSRVAQLARDGLAAAENQRVALATAFPGLTAAPATPRRHPLAQDLALAAGISRRAGDIADRLASVEERARHLTAAATAAVAAEERSATQQAQQRAERSSLRVTALLGAFIMLLTAVQALEYRVPLPGRIRPAVIAGLAATALLLAGWSAERTRHPENGLRARPPGMAFVPGLVAWAAALGWCVEGVWGAAREVAPATGRTLGAAALGAALALAGYAAAWWRRRRGR